MSINHVLFGIKCLLCEPTGDLRTSLVVRKIYANAVTNFLFKKITCHV